MEQVFYDLPILWMSGLRSRETVEAYSKLSKSRDLLMIAQKVIISECTTRAAKEATVQYISRFV